MSIAAVKAPKQKIVWYNGKSAKPEMIARALRALAMSLRIGQGEAYALETVGAQFKKYDVGRAMTRAARLMRENGLSVQGAIMAEDVFRGTVHELVEAAGTSQAVIANISKAAELVAQAQDVKKKLLTAMIQPMFMLAMSIVFLFVAAGWIIPGIVGSFTALNTEPPEVTVIVLNAAGVTTWVIGGLLVVVMLFTAYWFIHGKRSAAMRRMMSTVSLRLPLIGEVVKLAATSRMFELLSASLLSGRSEAQSLASAGAGSGNEAIKQHALDHSELMLKDGVPMRQFTQSNLFPESARYMLASAPSVKQEIDIMVLLGPEYRSEANSQLETFTKTVEPLMTYIVYGVAGLLIVAVMLPMYAMFPALMEVGGGSTPATPGVPPMP